MSEPLDAEVFQEAWKVEVYIDFRIGPAGKFLFWKSYDNMNEENFQVFTM